MKASGFAWTMSEPLVLPFGHVDVANDPSHTRSRRTGHALSVEPVSSVAAVLPYRRAHIAVHYPECLAALSSAGHDPRHFYCGFFAGDRLEPHRSDRILRGILYSRGGRHA